MKDKDNSRLQQEWISLHDNVERSEMLALGIKLLSVLITLAALIAQLESLVIFLLILVLWLQEAIWKTFQARSEQRLVLLEKVLLENNNDRVPGFYSSFEQNRPGVIALLKEYLSNAARPTVAYPYAVLILIVVVVAGFDS